MRRRFYHYPETLRVRTFFRYFCCLFLMAVASVSILSCGGGDDAIEKQPEWVTPNENGNKPENTEPKKNDSVQVVCYLCYGNKSCPTCNGTENCKDCSGTGKGCKQCGGTGKYCEKCNSTGKCIYCNGSGDCEFCHGTKERTCYICNGSGNCSGCYGTGRVPVYGGTCPSCRGSGNCSKCDGKRKIPCDRCNRTGHCGYCNDGDGKCTACKGEPNCKNCNGTGNCAQCNGDGHCNACRESKGKCPVCKGNGYTMEKAGTPDPANEIVTTDLNYVAFSAESETKEITVTANIEWNVSSNTASWLSASKVGDNTLRLTVYNNYSTQSRSGTVTIKGRSKFVDINVMQDGEIAGDGEPYAIMDKDAKTLTFYYDKKKTSRGGMDVTGPFNSSDNKPRWCDYSMDIETVVFDKSFAKCKSITTTSCWFYFCSNLTSFKGLEYFNTSNVKGMNQMFSGCMNLNSLDLSTFDTSNVNDMSFMFAYCKSLTSLDVSRFNTSKVENFNNMFWNCTSIISLDLSSFDTKAMRFISGMFENCKQLTTIYVGNGWTTNNLFSGSNTFINCESLVGGNGTTYDASHVDYTYARIDGGPSAPGYFTAK